ncbi:MAG: hypothetical protein AB8B87_14000 [Granulosicoccus sp.]
MKDYINHFQNESQVVHYVDPAKALEAERQLLDQFKNLSANFHIAWWSTTQSLIAPRSLRRAGNIEEAAALLSSMGWPLHFRQTGGDVTPQGPGILNIAVAFALDPTERPSISAVYEIFCEPLVQWLIKHGCRARTGCVPGSFCDGEYNIVVGTQKIAGTAQRWTRVRGVQLRQVVFAHALILLDADIDAGVAAINNLYEICGLDRSVNCRAHANLSDVLVKKEPQWQDCLVTSLNESYTRELGYLTS